MDDTPIHDAVQRHLDRYYDALEEICKQSLLNGLGYGVRVDWYNQTAYQIGINPDVPWCTIHEHRHDHDVYDECRCVAPTGPRNP